MLIYKLARSSCYIRGNKSVLKNCCLLTSKGDEKKWVFQKKQNSSKLKPFCISSFFYANGSKLVSRC